MTAVASHNITFLSHSDQGGRGDGVQVMVNKASPISATAFPTALP